MPNKEGLGISRKFADGSIHENASGQFKILDRYLDDEGIVMLEFEWLTGDNVGKVDTNKEKNINASIHKFKVSRGLPHSPSFTNISNDEICEKLDELLDCTDQLKESQLTKEYFKKQMEDILDNRLTKDYYEQTMESRKHINDSLDELQRTIIEQQKTINTLTHQIEKLVVQRETLNHQQEAMLKQQETLDKLVGIIASTQN